MPKSKRLLKVIIILALLAVILTFLWPHSLIDIAEVGIESISVVVVRNNLELSSETYTFNVGDSEFETVAGILNQNSYHVSISTILSVIQGEAHLEGNEAGYWVNIYLYTEPDCCGECYSIISGGTGDILINDNIYRMGYCGNGKVLGFMDAVCEAVNP